MVIKKCRKCGAESSSGVSRTFYYGSEINSRSTTISSSNLGTFNSPSYPSSKTIITTTNYRIGGSEVVFLCDKCISERKAELEKVESRTGVVATIAWTIIGTAIFIGSVVTATKANNNTGVGLMGLLFMIGGVIGFFFALRQNLLISRFLKKVELGQPVDYSRYKLKEDEIAAMATNYRMSDLVQQGYTKVFTEEEYKKLVPAQRDIRLR